MGLFKHLFSYCDDDEIDAFIREYDINCIYDALGGVFSTNTTQSKL